MGRELRREYGGFAAGWTGPIEALSSKATSERRAMSGKIEARLKELGIELPQPTAPLANYVPFTVSGDLVFIAGQISQWNGDLDRVRRCLRLGGFVNCTPDFTDMPQVINGASDLMVEVFGDAGRHARAAVGTSSLPGGVAVEVEATFELG